jgi:nucleoside-diphosphate-sugar epimerase
MSLIFKREVSFFDGREEQRKMKVAITGGTGCMGAPLTEGLIMRGFDVQLLGQAKDKRAHLYKERAQVITGDLNSSDALDKLTRGADVVFHLAGKVHSVPKTSIEEHDFFAQNVEGTKLLLEAARRNGVKRVVFYSTVAVYGKDADFRGDEVSPCAPESPYARSKHMAEQLVLNSRETEGPEGVVLRFPVAYGPWDRGNVASLIRAVIKKRFFYFGESNAVRSMISSRNAAEAALKAASEPQAANKVFCVTDGRDYSVKELVEVICRTVRTAWKPRHMPLGIAQLVGKLGSGIERITSIQAPVTSDIVRKLSRPLTFSGERANQLLGYQPVETLENGIYEEVRWLREVEKWV